MKEVEIDGKTYQYDSAKLMSPEMKVIQKYTGMTFGEWNDGLVRQDIEAIEGLVWLVRSRNGESAEIGEFPFDVYSIRIRDLDAPDEEEPDPTQTTSGEPSEESTDATPEASS